eukprot:45852-Eustigmatos_ZCMA.PRE.1
MLSAGGIVSLSTYGATLSLGGGAYSGGGSTGGDATLTAGSLVNSGTATAHTGGNIWLASGYSERSSSGAISIRTVNAGTSGVSGRL